MGDFLAIVGPTASGKTALSVALAQQMSAEVISADSMLVYKYMNIGTAKPTATEMDGVMHHMIDLVEPDTVFTVYDYQKRVFACIEEIMQRNNMPMLVGGTGLYVQSILDAYQFGPAHADPDYRKRLANIASSSVADRLHAALQKIDPEAADKIHPKDHRRVIRALEFYKATGELISEQRKHPAYLQGKGFRIKRIGLTMERELLYKRIEARVDAMIQQGFVAEVEMLHKMGYSLDHYPMQGLGYKQISQHLSGELSLPDAVAEIKKETRHFAKRQYTWFRRDSQIHWVHIDDFTNHADLVRNVCQMLKDI
jgi:tRNA dimethylallyltransferase